MTEHIQINDVGSRVQYLADGIQSAFTFPFAIFKLADLEVWHDDVLQTSGYAVSGAGVSTGGVALFTVPPAAGTRITLRRRLIIARTTDYQSDGLIRAKTLNDELDYQVAALQQVAEDVERAVRRAPTALAAIDLTLPEPAAGRSLKWNAGGTALVNSTHDPDVLGDALAAADQAMSAATAAALARDQAVAAVTSLTDPLSAAANLSDLDDVPLARTNLGVPAIADIAVSARTAETAVALDDLALVHDASAGADRKISIGNVLKAVNALTADASPDKGADYVMTWDASAGDVKKVLLSAVGGGGMWEFAQNTTIPPYTGAGSGVASVVFTGLDGAVYDYALSVRSVRGNNGSSPNLLIQFGYGAGPTYLTSYAQYAREQKATSADYAQAANAAITFGPIDLSTGIGGGWLRVTTGHESPYVNAEYSFFPTFPSSAFVPRSGWAFANFGAGNKLTAIKLSASAGSNLCDGEVALFRRLIGGV